MVVQEPETQVISATVRGELELPLELRGEPGAARARALEEVSLALGISHLLDRSTDTLSGGELQRVALAAALVLRPRLILLDEPTSQLDPVAGDELIGLLRRLNEEWGMCVVLAEHRLERCLAAADRVLAFDCGAVAFDGPPQAFCEWLDRRRSRALRRRARGCSRSRALRPLPTAVKAARSSLRELGIEVGPRDPGPAEPEKAGRGRRRRREPEPIALAAHDLWVELRHRRCGARRPARDRARGRAGRAGRADGPKRRRQEHPAARRGRPASSPCGARSRRPRGCALLPQSPSDLLVRERVGDELPGEAGHARAGVGRARVGGRARPARPLGRRARAAGAGDRLGRAGSGSVPGSRLPRRADAGHGRGAQASSSARAWARSPRPGPR